MVEARAERSSAAERAVPDVRVLKVFPQLVAQHVILVHPLIRAQVRPAQVAHAGAQCRLSGTLLVSHDAAEQPV